MPASLRAIVLAVTGQDVRRCSHCDFCAASLAPEQDLTLQSLVQLVIVNDKEALTSRTLWSERVLSSARSMCANGLNMEAVLLALRGEARRRGFAEPPEAASARLRSEHRDEG